MVEAVATRDRRLRNSALRRIVPGNLDVFTANGIPNCLSPLRRFPTNNNFLGNVGGFGNKGFLGSLADLNNALFERSSTRAGSRPDRLTPFHRHFLALQIDILLDGLLHDITTDARRSAINDTLPDPQFFLRKRDDLLACRARGHAGRGADERGAIGTLGPPSTPTRPVGVLASVRPARATPALENSWPVVEGPVIGAMLLDPSMAATSVECSSMSSG